MMVADADMQCEYVAEKDGHPDYVVVDVTTGDHLIDGKAPDTIMTRVKKGYGATYHNNMDDGMPPMVKRNGQPLLITDAWICPVTYLVLGRYPKQINIYLK